MKKAIHYLGTIIFFIIVIFFIRTIKNYQKDSSMIPNEELEKQYIYLPKSIEVSNKVDSTFRIIVTNPRGGFNIRLENGLKFRAIASVIPKEKDISDRTKKNLYNFLERGDSIFKPKNKDYIIVYKNNREYTYFIPTKEFHDSIFPPKK